MLYREPNGYNFFCSIKTNYVEQWLETYHGEYTHNILGSSITKDYFLVSKHQHVSLIPKAHEFYLVVIHGANILDMKNLNVTLHKGRTLVSFLRSNMKPSLRISLVSFLL